MNLDQNLRQGALPLPQNTLGIEYIPVVMSFTEDVAPYAITSMLSALKAAFPGVRLAFYVLYLKGELLESTQEKAKRILQTTRSVLHFVDLSPYLEDFDPPRFGHMPRNIFFRLAIPALFSKFRRVIFMDGDVYVRKCLSLLYYSMNNRDMVGATRDLLLQNAVKDGFRLSEDFGGLTVQEYQEKYLGISNSEDYFQGGVVVFNIQKIPQEKSAALWEEAKQLFWLMDQDILNKVFRTHVQYFIPNWNMCMGSGCLEASEKLEPKDRGLFKSGASDPCIVHFTGWPKPWNGFEGPWSNEYRSLLSSVMS